MIIRNLLISLAVLAIIIMAVAFAHSCIKPSDIAVPLERTGTIVQVTAYIGTTTIDGIATREQFGTEVFFDDGGSLRLAGAHQFKIGTYYRIQYVPPADPGWDWSELK